MRTMNVRTYRKTSLDEILRIVIVCKWGQIFQLGVLFLVCLPDGWIHPPIDYQGQNGRCLLWVRNRWLLVIDSARQVTAGSGLRSSLTSGSIGTYVRGAHRGTSTPDSVSKVTFAQRIQPSPLSCGASVNVARGQTSR